MKRKLLFLIVVLISVLNSFSAFSNETIDYVPQDVVLYSELRLHDYPKLINEIIPRLLNFSNIEQKLIKLSTDTQKLFGIDLTDTNKFSSESGINFQKKAGFAISDFYSADYGSNLNWIGYIPLKDKDKFKKVFTSAANCLIERDKIRYNLIQYKNTLIYSIETFSKDKSLAYKGFSHHESAKTYNYEDDKVVSPQKEISPSSQKNPILKEETKESSDGDKKITFPATSELSTYTFHEVVSFMYIDDYLVVSNHTQGLKTVIDTVIYKTSLNNLHNFKYFYKAKNKNIITGYINTDIIDINPSLNLKELGGIYFTFDANLDKINFDFQMKFDQSSSFYKWLASGFTFDKRGSDLFDYLPKKKISLFMNSKINPSKLIGNIPYSNSILVIGIYTSLFWGMRSFSHNYYDQFTQEPKEPEKNPDLYSDQFTSRTGLSYLSAFKWVKNLENDFSFVLFQPSKTNIHPKQLLFNTDYICWAEIKNKGYSASLIHEIISAVEISKKKKLEVKEILINKCYFYKIELPYSNNPSAIVEHKELINEEKKFVYAGVFNKYLILASDDKIISDLINNFNHKRKTTKLRNLVNIPKNASCTFYLDAELIRIMKNDIQLIPSYDYFYGYSTFNNGILFANLGLVFK